MHRNPSDAAPETCELKIVNFKHGQPEEFLQIMKNFKGVVGRTGKKKAAEKTNYLLTILRGEALQEFEKLAIQNVGTNITPLKLIQEGLPGYSFLVNAHSKQKRVMRRDMHKP